MTGDGGAVGKLATKDKVEFGGVGVELRSVGAGWLLGGEGQGGDQECAGKNGRMDSDVHRFFPFQCDIDCLPSLDARSGVVVCLLLDRGRGGGAGVVVSPDLKIETWAPHPAAMTECSQQISRHREQCETCKADGKLRPLKQ